MPIVLPEVDRCFLCELVDAGWDHWSVWAETGLTLTVVNGRQFETGQSLVIPKRHTPTIMDLTPDETAEIFEAAQTAARVLEAAFDPDGILLYQNNGVASLQEVPHFHLHVVPRHAGSDWGDGPPHLAELKRRAGNPKYDYTEKTADKVATAERLRQHTRGPTS